MLATYERVNIYDPRCKLLEDSVDAPNSEVVVDGLPGRELVRQQTPSAATTNDVEDGVKDLT